MKTRQTLRFKKSNSTINKKTSHRQQRSPTRGERMLFGGNKFFNESMKNAGGGGRTGGVQLLRGGRKDMPKAGEELVQLPLNTSHDRSSILSKNTSFDDNLFVRESHNCYTYFLNLKSQKAVDLCKDDFGKYNMCRRAQPGYLSGHPMLQDKDYNCPEIMKRTLDDNPEIYQVKSIKDKCDPDFYKGALVVAPGRDYHYYRQDDDNYGYWSHKPGYKPSTIRDSNNNLIDDPQTAAKDYGDTLNYKDFCGYLCVPRSGQRKAMAHRGEDGKPVHFDNRKLVQKAYEAQEKKIGKFTDKKDEGRKTQKNKLTSLGKKVFDLIQWHGKTNANSNTTGTRKMKNIGKDKIITENKQKYYRLAQKKGKKFSGGSGIRGRRGRHATMKRFFYRNKNDNHKNTIRKK